YTTRKPPDCIRSKLYLREAVHIGHDLKPGQHELQRHEHRNGAGRFHDRTSEYSSAARHNDVVSEPAVLWPLPAGHLEDKLASDGEWRRPMGTVPLDAGKAKAIRLFRPRGV